MAREVTRFRISDLIPYEPSAISGKVSKLRRVIEKAKDPFKEVPPVEILQIDEALMVTNGTNRVKAFLLEGYAEVPGELTHRSPQELGPYREALTKNATLKGFSDLPEDVSLGDRSARY
ncbi:MAG: hypothetical protein FLDDKLPJ_02342 [Phycisphaerae bacterium]|nr:hypothetical protein [Phycisphaerae bacterium]